MLQGCAFESHFRVIGGIISWEIISSELLCFNLYFTPPFSSMQDQLSSSVRLILAPRINGGLPSTYHYIKVVGLGERWRVSFRHDPTRSEFSVLSRALGMQGPEGGWTIECKNGAGVRALEVAEAMGRHVQGLGTV